VAVTTNDPGNSGVDAVAIDGMRTRRIVPDVDFTWPLSAYGDVLLYSPEPRAYATDVFSVSISGTDAEPKPFAAAKADEFQAQFSPDGRFVAYVSNQTGRQEVFVTTYPPSSARWQVSQKGGVQPRWSRDGRELFFMDPENYLVAVEVEKSAAGFQMGASRPLFQFYASTGFWRYDVGPDGQRFLVTAPLEEDLTSPVTLITDWPRIVQSR
jgi:hypothetical protein